MCILLFLLPLIGLFTQVITTILSLCNAREKILSHQRMQLTHYTTMYLAVVVRQDTQDLLFIAHLVLRQV